MKPLAFLLILSGLVLLGLSAYDEHREIASAIPPGRDAIRITIKKADDPKQFRNLMTYEWIRGFLTVGAGAILMSFCNRADKLDPFSPDFEGDKELDELKDEIDREERKQKRPFE